MNLDLDAAKRARAEQKGEAPTLTFGGRTFALPTEIPFAFAEKLSLLKYREATQELLEDETEAFFALRPSSDDMTELLNGISELYAGADAGESKASASSSKRTTKSSKPRSKAATA